MVVGRCDLSLHAVASQVKTAHSGSIVVMAARVLSSRREGWREGHHLLAIS